MKRFSPHVFIVCVLFALSISASFAQPISDFTANKTSGCSPLVVSFQNLSANAVSYEWSTGISTTTLSNPTVLYSNPGTYQVSLVAIDSQGNRDTLVRSQYITVFSNPVADFSVSVTDICVHAPVSFTDLSQPGSGAITQWSWDYGDGKSGSGSSPQHAYTSAGQYPVSLQVTNSDGCSNSILKQNLIEVIAPETEFTSSNNVSCGAPLSVNFSPLQATGLSHEWDFGDGSGSTASAPSHTYLTTGSFDVVHITADPSGCKDTLTKTAFVNIGANTLSAFASDSSLCEGDSVYFTAVASSSSTISWNFGNGDTGSGIHPGYVYQTAGQYTVTVNISDPAGCQVTQQIPITVTASPTADFSILENQIGCEVPYTVNFVNNSSGGVSYFWSFFDGSGSNSNATTPTWTYTSVDSFSVRLVVTAPGGCQATKTEKNYIKIRPIEIGFEADVEEGCAPLTVQFSDTSKSAYPIINWSWNFGDGNSGSGISPTHTYATPGIYDVQLIIVNSQGCSDTLNKVEYISAGTKPTANFIADTLTACALGEVNFINMSSNATDYVWYFGDGDTAMSANPAHGFAALGPMDVVLIANNNGCSDTLYRPGYIDVLAPLPVIGMTGRYLCRTPETVQFINLSIGDDAWQWTLPDGNIVTDSVTSFTFTQNGQFPISLMVTNHTTGCQVEITDSVYVRSIVAAFSMTPLEGCKPLNATFTDSTIGAIDWSWSFGDGGTSSNQSTSHKYTITGYHQVSLTVENNYGCKDTKVIDSVRVSHVIPRISTNSPTTGCIPLTMAFEDSSTVIAADNLSWLWEFGDGTISTLQNPNHTYTQAGDYVVKLTVTTDLGCSKTTVFEQEISVSDPLPSFLPQPAITCPGSPVTFVSTSTGSGLEYIWNLGDGNSSVAANPVHAYADTGAYDVSLTITDTYGCTRTVSQPGAVYVQDLFADFTADTTFAACPPLNVSFSAKNDFPHPGIFFEWDFGDGSSGNQPDPSRVFTQPGNYDIQLIVGTPYGCRDTLMKPAYINIEGPSASFSFTPDQGCPGTEVDFQATSPDTVSYQWIYGDGATGTGATSSHVYQTPGAYLPVLIIEDTNGCTVFSYARDPLEIFTPPTASFKPGQQEACDSISVNFKDKSQGSVVSWAWDFGDGGSSSSQTPLHQFSLPGRYAITLQVTDVNGCTDSVTVPDAVIVHALPDPLIDGAPVDGCAPQTVSLTALDNGHPALIQTYNWFSGAQQHQGQNWNPTFIQAGIHSINLEVTDEHGCIGTVTEFLEAYPNPVADFGVDDQESCAPALLQFSDLSQGRPILWEWSFGDTGTSTIKDPGYTYLQNGQFDVELIVENVYGCRDTILKPAFITLTKPIADFSASDVTGCPGTSFVFSDESQSQRPLASWNWELGDGNQAAGEEITHQYALSGLYDVTIIVTDSEGCSDSLTRTNLISVEEDAPAIPLQMSYASVVSDSEVFLEYEEYDDRRNDFGAYLIYRSDNGITYQIVDSIFDHATTEYLDQSLNTRDQRYWYKVVPRNNCLNPAPWDSIQAHTTIQLVTYPGLDEATLQWTGYKGWADIERYEVFRVTGYEPSNQMFLGTTTGEDSSFTDIDFRCDEDYSYRVVAVLGPLRAGSDSSFTDPLHLGPADPTNMIRATVEADRSVLVEWEDAGIDLAETVVVERSDGLGYSQISVTPYQPGASKVTDSGARTSEVSYTYRVMTIDSCGDATPVGLTGKTILLSANREFGGTDLSWTPYQGWESGVEGYTVEVFHEELQQWVVVTQLDGTATAFFDQKTEFNQATYCYRITAWEYRGNQATSRSNEVCVEPEPYLYVANAFTPNGDGYNDEFTVGMAFVGNVNIEIFNRWGKKVFEASSLEIPWQGNTSKGLPAPEGVYVYKIIATGYNGTVVEKSGTITLLR